MEFDKIESEDGEVYLAHKVGECEGVNPVDFYEKFFIESKRLLFKQILKAELKARSMHLDTQAVEKVALKNAIDFWLDKREEILSIQIPETFKKLLSANRKKNQIKLLKGFSLKPLELLACIFYAHNEHGYLLSQYEGEHDPIGTESNKKPKVIYVDKSNVHKVGESELTDGQLKHIVEQKKRTVAKLIEKGRTWHCFFITYSSLRGEESWKDGQAHFHYISDKFGITKEHLIQQIRSRRYNLGNLPHIDLIGYGEDE